MEGHRVNHLSHGNGIGESDGELGLLVQSTDAWNVQRWVIVGYLHCGAGWSLSLSLDTSITGITVPVEDSVFSLDSAASCSSLEGW